MNRPRSSVQRYPWRPVPVRELAPLWGLRKLAGESEYAETGEWQCVAADIAFVDVGVHVGSECCRVYHRSRETSERHCAKLARRVSQ